MRGREGDQQAAHPSGRQRGWQKNVVAKPDGVSMPSKGARLIEFFSSRVNHSRFQRGERCLLATHCHCHRQPNKIPPKTCMSQAALAAANRTGGMARYPLVSRGRPGPSRVSGSGASRPPRTSIPPRFPSIQSALQFAWKHVLERVILRWLQGHAPEGTLLLSLRRAVVGGCSALC